MSESRPGSGMASGAVLRPFSTSRRRTEENPKGLGSGKDREETEDRDTGSILVDYQTEGTEDRVQLLIVRAERETYRDRLRIGDCMYGEERSMYEGKRDSS